MSQENPTIDRQNALKLAYERACESYDGITDFRGKLLTLLPLASGTGVFLLLDSNLESAFLGPIGLFGVVVTSGLYMYEFRGIQRCHRLEVQAARLEKDLGLSAQLGQFRGQPARRLKNMLGPPGAGLVVYIAVIFAWVYVAGVGIGLWDEGSKWVAWFLVPVYLGFLVALWALFKRRMHEWAQRGADPALQPEEPARFETKLPSNNTAGTAGDLSLRRTLLGVHGGELAHVELPPGTVTVAVHHPTVEEIWLFVTGRGTMWRRDSEHEEEVKVGPGVCLTIPLGTHFQLRSERLEPLTAVVAMMGPWAGAGEAIRVCGPWSPNVPAGPGLA